MEVVRKHSAGRVLACWSTFVVTVIVIVMMCGLVKGEKKMAPTLRGAKQYEKTKAGNTEALFSF